MTQSLLSRIFGKNPVNHKDELYCSVDLEFTGFDPSRDQILEIGFAFFKVSADGNGFEITEKWSQVFKPSIEVHPKILGLTGITQEELDAAPEFNDYREFLQEKLGNAIILGHNPVMDVKFLEAYGIKLSGKTVDTLELVQFILPTHHSYNLENLVHYFGIKHAVAHRALGDALSTIYVLENLIQVYNQFPEELKSELQKVFNRGDFLWERLLSTKLKSKQVLSNDSLKHIESQKNNLESLDITDDLIILDNNQVEHITRAALGLKKENKKYVFAVPDSSSVMRLWKDGLVHGLFRRDDTFSKSAFDTFLKQADTNEQLRFCLKIIVWLYTNWQTEVVFDLNISFFGGQFRQFIVGGEIQPNDNEQILCLDYTTLDTLTRADGKSFFADRTLVVCEIQNFEKYLSTGFGTRLSWNGVLYSLKMIYNPETNFGNTKIKKAVLDALAGTDLFFSLVLMSLQKRYANNQYVGLTELDNDHPTVFNDLNKAAENLIVKLSKVISMDPTAELQRSVHFLKSFFNKEEGRVKWVTMNEENLSLHDQPVEISGEANTIMKVFHKTQFTETTTSNELLSYYVDRLGLHTEQSEFISKSNNNFKYVIEDKTISEQELYELATTKEQPMVIVFDSPTHIKSFYNSYYSKLKEKSALFAQGYSGGGNKMFRNFAIKKNSVLLVTSEFMAKQNYVIPSQTIVFTTQPKVEVAHPYIAALLNRWKEQHLNLENLLSIAKVFAAIKKIKNNNEVSIYFYNFNLTDEEKNIFVDNSR